MTTLIPKYDEGATGAVNRPINQKLAEIVSVKDFGAVGDGTTDDTAAVQAALDAVATNGKVVGDASSVFKIMSRINVNSKQLVNINLKYGSNNAYIVLLGFEPTIKNVSISVGTTSPSSVYSLQGVINPVNTENALIDNLEITDAGLNRYGIWCSTKAYNTVIRNCRMDYIGWPILFNDNASGAGARTVDGVTYTGTIGYGLNINGCFLGAAGKTEVGDAIEISCPNYKFTNVVVNNCTALKTNTTSSNGLGFGFAGIRTLQVLNSFLTNVASGAGAIHAEDSYDVIVSNNIIKTSLTGIGFSYNTSNTTVSNNIIKECNVGLTFGSVDSTYIASHYIISGNQFINTVNYPVIGYNSIADVIFTNNIFDVITTSSKTAIQFVSNSPNTISKVLLMNNSFYGDQINDFILLGATGTAAYSEFLSEGNQFANFTSNTNFALFLQTIASIGLTKDHYKNSTGTTKGMLISVVQDPNGYVTGTTGDIAFNVNGGEMYIHNGTSWVLKLS
jgi:hypothetical protein